MLEKVRAECQDTRGEPSDESSDVGDGVEQSVMVGWDLSLLTTLVPPQSGSVDYV